MIDFKRQFAGLSCTVETIEYDPNRTARIALVKYENGKRDLPIKHLIALCCLYRVSADYVLGIEKVINKE